MRKNYFLVLLLLLYSGGILAQTVNTSVASQMNTIFGPLEKNRIPNNILLDYGIEFIDINKYDGFLRSDNYINIAVYKDAYNSLVSSRTALGVPGLEPPIQEESEWKNLQGQKNNKISNTASMVLSGLYYTYSKIRSDALSNNKIKVVNGKYDDSYVNGIWQNPYETKQAFAISAPIQEVNQPNVSVSLPATLWHTNQTSSVSSIHVDFGNGTGYKSLDNNGLANTYYNSPGVYTWTYRLQLTNGQYKYCRQKVKVTVPTATKVNNGCDLQEQPITATRAYNGIAGSATLQIAYGSIDCRLRKPLIVVEGLDTGLLGPTGRIGDSDIETFTERINESNSIDLQNLITNNTAVDYDLVYVNWDNGTDYLQRNAYVLEEVIKWVNQEKAANGSTTPNVVLGQSMGGLIARYALKEMEDDPSLSHDTSLYISHDAPHQGAHVPLGFLYMARHAVDQFISTPLGNISIPVSSGNVGLESVNDILDAPAVKQMLINYVTSNFEVDNTLHNIWQNELKLMGYPLQTRNIALSNASHCAEPQLVNAGDRLFTLDAYGKTTFLTDFILTLNGFNNLSGQLSALLLDEAGLLLGVLPGRSKFDIDFYVNAYPASGSSQIYYGKIRYTKTLLWLIPISVDLTNRSYNSPSGTLPLDTYPGGKNPSFENININTFENNAFVKYGYTVDLEPNFNFLPATSALDVGKNNVVLTNSDFLKVYTAANPPTGNKTIPFDNFTTSYNTSIINEPHLFFSRNNSDWLAEELDADSTIDVFDCTFICQVIAISGNSNLCSSQTYSVQSGSTNVIWSASSTKVNLSNSTTGQVVVSPANSNSKGNVTLTATISSSDCGSVTVSKVLYVGTPYANLPQASPICTNVFLQSETYTLPSSQGADSYRLVSSSPYLLIEGGSEETYSYAPYPVNFMASRAGTYLVELFTTNSCGISRGAMYITAENCGGGFFTYAISPNPASEEISIVNTAQKSNTSSSTQNIVLQNNQQIAKLYDFNGAFIKIVKLDPYGITKLDVSDLKQGYYFLKIMVGKEEETYKIIVAH